MVKALIGALLVAASILSLAAWTSFVSLPSRRQDRAILPTAQIDKSTQSLFRRACQNCHSENTRVPWYGRLPIGSWLVKRDIEDARRRLNLSSWNLYGGPKREELLTRIGSVVRNKQMPLPRYIWLHHEAALTLQERQQIYGWTRAERKRLRAISF
jgi:mono/diheme cytochrome c family protein